MLYSNAWDHRNGGQRCCVLSMVILILSYRCFHFFVFGCCIGSVASDVTYNQWWSVCHLVVVFHLCSWLLYTIRGQQCRVQSAVNDVVFDPWWSVSHVDATADCCINKIRGRRCCIGSIAYELCPAMACTISGQRCCIQSMPEEAVHNPWRSVRYRWHGWLLCLYDPWTEMPHRIHDRRCHVDVTADCCV